METEHRPDTRIAVLIPCYNESAAIAGVVADFRRALPAADIHVYDNNSSDDTGEVARRFAATRPYIRVIDEMTQGKGAAVHTGMLAAAGEYLFMADADFSMPVQEIAKFLPPNLSQYDIAIGSREAPGAVRYNEPSYRHWGGRGINFLIQMLILPGLNDTQCGFKCFRGEVAQNIFSRQTLYGWSFDIELLYIARRHGYGVVEIPIHWYHFSESKVSALRDALDAVRADAVLQTIRIAHAHFVRTGQAAPRIAVAGLNPHAGEGGLFGREEIEHIAPAVAAARAQGIDASGPHPPDTVFMRARQGVYDVVVAMYHDQGLIPVKLLGVEHGVNTTLGLPFVRTSPDHGTAFDIAGQGVASASSLLAAIDAAVEATQA